MCEPLTIGLDDGSTVSLENPSRVIDVLEDDPSKQRTMVAARLNNQFVSLMDFLQVGGTLKPVFLDETAGMRVYRNSLIFLFAMAAEELFPHRRLVIGHALGHAFYHRFQDDGLEASDADARAIMAMMTQFVKDDLPIYPDQMSCTTAIHHFQKHNRASTVRLLGELNEPQVGVWRCGGHLALRHAPLLPRTGLLSTFAVEHYGEGFLLRYPPSQTPNTLGPPDTYPKLYSVYKEYKHWGEILRVSTVAQLNALSRNLAEAKDFIQTAEALHNRKFAEIAGSIFARRDEVKAVMIAGPSSSGKTTFTKKLALSLKSMGLRPQLISLDDYYRERKDIPLDSEGNPDFETLEALDLNLFDQNFHNLLSGKETEVPVFDFKNIGGRRPRGRTLKMDRQDVLLFEGIHGLNPRLTASIQTHQAFRIYISALTQLNLDDHNRIPTTDNRLVRRIVRDHQFRRYPVIDTLKIWPSVRRGEEKHIFPWQESADALFNSALDYELAVLKIFAEPLLRTVSQEQAEYGEARRLMAFLRNFSPFPVEEVPELSIVREFIGRSGFRYS